MLSKLVTCFVTCSVISHVFSVFSVLIVWDSYFEETSSVFPLFVKFAPEHIVQNSTCEHQVRKAPEPSPEVADCHLLAYILEKMEEIALSLVVLSPISLLPLVL